MPHTALDRGYTVRLLDIDNNVIEYEVQRIYLGVGEYSGCYDTFIELKEKETGKISSDLLSDVVKLLNCGKMYKPDREKIATFLRNNPKPC